MYNVSLLLCTSMYSVRKALSSPPAVVLSAWSSGSSLLAAARRMTDTFPYSSSQTQKPVCSKLLTAVAMCFFFTRQYDRGAGNGEPGSRQGLCVVTLGCSDSDE